jgi:NitT/TauT family transport system permease protein
MRERGTQAASVLILVGVWILVAELVGTHIIPGPWQVGPELWDLLQSGDFVDPLMRSLIRVTLGFSLAFVLGLVYGIVAGSSDRFAYASSAVVNILLLAPSLVVIFLGIIMLGATDLTAVLVAGLLVSVPIGVYMRSVVQALDRDVLEMADSYKIGKIDRIRGIYLPYLIPPMLASTRTGITDAWKVILLIEVFGLAGGLGFEIRRSYFIYNLPLLFSWLVIIVIVLLVLEQLLRGGERAIVRWR